MPRAVIDNMNNGGGAMRIDLLQCACCRCYPDDATILTLAIRALSVDTMSAQYLGPTIDPSCTGDCSRMPRPARRSRRRCIKSFAAGAACSANCSRLRHPPKLSRPALQSDTLSSPLVKLSWRLSLQACLPPSRTAIYQLSRARGRLPQRGSRRRRCAEREKNGVRC